MTYEKQRYKQRLMAYHGTGRGDGRGKYEGFGESHHLREWARILSLPPGSLSRYLKKGLTIEEIVEVRGIDYPNATETPVQ